MKKPKQMSASVPEELAALANLYKERNKVYGDNYLHAGAALMALFPNGYTLETPTDFGRMALFIHMFTKLTRIAQELPRGNVHFDSCKDIAVYSMMLQEIGHEQKQTSSV